MFPFVIRRVLCGELVLSGVRLVTFVTAFALGGADSPSSIVLPALTLGLAGAAWYSRLLRGTLLGVLDADYIRTARAKGLSWRAVIIRHALRNAAGPGVTQIGLDLGYFF